MTPTSHNGATAGSGNHNQVVVLKPWINYYCLRIFHNTLILRSATSGWVNQLNNISHWPLASHQHASKPVSVINVHAQTTREIPQKLGNYFRSQCCGGSQRQIKITPAKFAEPVARSHTNTRLIAIKFTAISIIFVTAPAFATQFYKYYRQMA
jgi:hypothetical protein